MGRFLVVTIAAAALALSGLALALAQGVPPSGGWGGGWGGMGGMMGGGSGYGPGGMMGGGGGYGPYGPTGNPYQTPPTLGGLTIDQAAAAVQTYLATLGTPDLKVAEVMEFSYNFYAEVEEESTGIHAMELLIDRYTGAVYPEMGPNMMWNTRYSPMVNMMGGMMGWGWSGSWGNTTATISAEQAREIANQWLARYLPSTTAGEVDAFYGYYTLHTQRDDRITGMLSVNAYTGQVWYHTWHGGFVQMRELE